MEQNLQNTVALLTRTPAALEALLYDLPEAWTLANEGENTWNIPMVVAHMIHGEVDDWLPRARLILESRELPTFAPFNREGHSHYTRGKTLGQLLDAFARRRAQNLDELRTLHLTSEDLARRARHPALGPVTLSELLASWAVHDLTHLHQISRILAYQYREAVGPWAKFMGVMSCAGHSASVPAPDVVRV
jgi:hypothetical protein